MINRTEDHVAGLLRDGERIERRLRALEQREAVSPAVMVQRVTSVEAQLASVAKRVGTLSPVERDGFLEAIVTVTRENFMPRFEIVPRLEALEAARIIERQLLEALEACGARIAALEAKPVPLVHGGPEVAKQPKAARPRKARGKARAPRTSPKSTKQRKRAA